MRKIFLFFSAITFFSIAITAQVKVENLLTENRSNPIGIDAKQPRFTWQLTSDKRNVMQAAYEVKVYTAEKSKTPNWSSGKIISNQSVHVPYSGETLQSRKKYFWQVRVWDNQGNVSAWSEPAFFQTGFYNAEDWKAKWISPGYTEDSVMRQSPLFRKEFVSTKKIRSATAYITAHGLYEAQLNGHRVGDAYLTPGWTSYNKRLEYQVYDVTDLINAGKMLSL